MNINAPINTSSVARLLEMNPATHLDVNHVAMQFTGDVGRVAAHFAGADPWNAHAPRKRLEDAILRNLIGDDLMAVIEGHRVAEATGDLGDLENAYDCLMKEVAT